MSPAFLLILISQLGQAAPKHSDPVCGTDSVKAWDYRRAIFQEWSFASLERRGLEWKDSDGPIAQIKSDSVCALAIRVYNRGISANHPARIAAPVYVFRLGNAYVITVGDILAFYHRSWKWWFTVTDID